jgi:polyisoprenoid-binding protein YceI
MSQPSSISQPGPGSPLAPPSPLPAELTPGSWVIDPVHSTASFALRHARVSTVRGTVAITDGLIVVGDSLATSSVHASLDPARVHTGNESRDEKLRSDDFFGVEAYPLWSFVSTAVLAGSPGHVIVRGELTIHGRTQIVDLDTQFEGVGDDAAGNVIAGFAATTALTRRQFGLEWAGRSKAGNAIVGDRVTVQLDIAAVRQR